MDKHQSKYGMSPDKAVKVFNFREGSKLKKMRVKRGLSQQGLAELAGVKRRLIQTYEQGSRNIHNGRIDYLCDLAIALDCKISDILEDETLIEKLKSCT